MTMRASKPTVAPQVFNVGEALTAEMRAEIWVARAPEAVREVVCTSIGGESVCPDALQIIQGQ